MKSTGPKTVEGKAVSRTNSFKHGLSGDGVVCLAAASPEMAERLERWAPSYEAELAEGPHREEREFLFTQVVLNTWRIEAAQRREVSLGEKSKRRAKVAWTIDQSLLAETLGSKLAKAAIPSLLIAKLWTFLQGIQWMLAQWTELKVMIEARGEVGEPQATRVWDLMGISREIRGDLPRLDLAEARRLIEAEIQKLNGDMLTRFKALDIEECLDAQNGRPTEISKEERLNRRYEDLAHRRYLQARAALRELMATMSAAISTASTAFFQGMQNQCPVETERREMKELIAACAPDERSLKFLSGELDLRAEAEAKEAELAREQELQTLEEEEEETSEEGDEDDEPTEADREEQRNANAIAKARRKQKKAQRQSRNRNRRRR